MFREGIASLGQGSGIIYVLHQPQLSFLQRVVYGTTTVPRKEKEVGVLQETCSARILLIRVLHWLAVL